MTSGVAMDSGLLQRYAAHEFRSHLNVVVCAAMLLSQRWASQDEQGMRLCASLNLSADLLLRMVGDWHVAGVDAPGGFSVDCEPLELKPWLVAWLASYSVTGAPAQDRIHPEPLLLFNAADDACVLVDSLRLSQCLFNLVSNAFKYGGDAAAIRLEVHRAESELLIVVADAGKGLCSEQGERLFKPFVRLEPDSEIPGEGLGLSLTRVLVEAMGGRIGVESAVGSGTRFTIALRSA